MHTIKISLDQLFLDPNNFRLKSDPQYKEVIDPTLQKIKRAAVRENFNA
jgi:hypothetical protein